MFKKDIVKECEKIINKKHTKGKKIEVAKRSIYFIVVVGAIIKLIIS